MKRAIMAAALASIAMPVSVAAQDTVMVTAIRIERTDYDEYCHGDQSAIGLTRKADFYLKPIYVNSDSRDAKVRSRCNVTRHH